MAREHAGLKAWTILYSQELSSSHGADSGIVSSPSQQFLWLRCHYAVSLTQPLLSLFPGVNVQMTSILMFHQFRYLQLRSARLCPQNWRPHSLCIPAVWRKFYLAFSQDLILCGKDHWADASLETSILTFSNQGSIVAYPAYLHNFHFLFLTFIFISQISFNNPLPWVALEYCFRWT